MSPQSDPSEPPPPHPGPGEPDAEQSSHRSAAGAHPVDPPPDRGGDGGSGQALPPVAGQPTPQQPYDQQTPPGYGHPGYSPSGYPQPGYGPQPYSQLPGVPPGYPQQGLAPVSPSDEKLWAVLAHLSIPFFGFVAPLVIYLAFKDRSAWLRDSALEALNFSIVYTIAITASAFLAVLLIGLVLLPLVWVVAVVLCLRAAVASNRHERYRYPLNWRLVT